MRQESTPFQSFFCRRIMISRLIPRFGFPDFRMVSTRFARRGAEFYEVAPQSNDINVKKHRYSGFVHTRLESILRTLKIETLIITGVSTNLCVESTARDGFMLDYRIVLLKDACAAFSQEEHDMTLKTVDTYFGMVADTEQVVSFWRMHAPQSPQFLT